MDKKKEGIKKGRYSEKEIIKGFLCSKEGIQFINKNINLNKTTVDVEREIENLIDFYTAWSQKVPVRKASKMSKYEFVKFIEDYCEKNGMYLMFEFMFE